MKTTLEISTIVYQRIAGSPLEAAISGEVYKDERPANSNLEDVVVNIITTDAEMLQEGVGNVNIHVPNMSSGLPNHGRLSALAVIAAPILKEGNGTDYSFWTENQSLIKDPSSGAYYVNFRFRFKHHNTIIN